MKIPPPADSAVRRFAALVPKEDSVEVRKVFGQPGAFIDGNMFFGVFGDSLFLRLSEADRREVKDSEGAKVFEPMPGRAMAEYITIPERLLGSDPKIKAWISRAVAYGRTLPKKSTKSKGRKGKA